MAGCKNRGSFNSKFVLDPNPSLMAKCIETTNGIPTAWAAFRDGAEKVPMCPSAQNDSSFHLEIVTQYEQAQSPRRLDKKAKSKHVVQGERWW